MVIAGGSGFIGRALAGEGLKHGRQTVVLTRSPHERTDGPREVFWDGKTPGDWVQLLDGADALVNLAGRSVNCRHTPENLREIAASRIRSVEAIAAGIARTAHPPRVWVQAGAVGFYGDRGNALCDEDTPPGNDALAEVCQVWENAFHSVSAPNTRRVLLRIGFVLGRGGGALPVLAKLAKCFLGGAAGGGKQFISWIHLADLTGMFAAALEQDDLTGTFNAVGPNPATNAEFMRGLRHALHRPWSPPAPAWAVKLGSRLMGSEPSLALSGCRVAPQRFRESGFQFQFPELPAALENIFGNGE
ncbi:MAG: TIGR01777 family oxidoreductase [Verrucomicrobiota bacterium]|nr:TIGR01777 family oxidoreductase [Verrucomicrobiota bacterium]